MIAMVVSLAGNAAALPALAATDQDRANPHVAPPQSKPYGKSYGEWNKAWWQWALSIPVPPSNPSAHPLFDATGENCAAGQSGRVWFLGGSFASGNVNRRCVIPNGTSLFFPLRNTERDNLANPYRTEEDMRTAAIARMNLVTNLAASLDGRPITDLTDYRISTIEELTGFNFTLPAQNVFTFFGQNAPAGNCRVPPGSSECVPYLAVSDGYYLMLRPLSIGEHTLQFQGTLAGNPLNVTYTLVVEH
jgi:hypothetical protein